MVDQTQDMQAVEQKEASAASTPGARRRTIVFLVIFLTSVSLLLVGYQFVTNSLMNQWYLFQVARHTSWALNLVGEGSELEPTRFTMDSARVRATLDAWAQGEDTPRQFDLEKNANTPLTAWESWRYRAGILREQGVALNNDGPYVRFLQRESLQKRIQELNNQIGAVQRDAGLAEPQAARVAALEAQVAALAAERDSLPKTEFGDPVDPRRLFIFRVVSECGAIEAMAIFFSAVLAFPTRWWKRLAGIVVGIPLLYGVNIARLTCLGYIGALDNGGEIFSFAHEYVWQGLYIIFVVAIWLLWVELLVRRVT